MKLYSAALQRYCNMVEEAIPAFLPPVEEPEEVVAAGIADACIGAGKRLRAVLVMAFAALHGGDVKAMPFAVAIECIHAASLVHDDMPCMDNSLLRRGKPSIHAAYGEAMAMLVGDSLIVQPFLIMLSETVLRDMPLHQVVHAARTLAEAAGYKANGTHGLMAGQMLDIQSEGKEIGFTELERLQMGKTGVLIRAACKMGVIVANGGEEAITAADAFGKALGQCFQIVDDILDVTATEQELGKPVGGDAQKKKSTFVSLLGLQGAKKLAQKRCDEAIEALAPYGERAHDLRQLAQALLVRTK